MKKDKHLLPDTNVDKTTGWVSLSARVASTASQKQPQTAVKMTMMSWTDDTFLTKGQNCPKILPFLTCTLKLN